jgi:hypothetical protein
VLPLAGRALRIHPRRVGTKTDVLEIIITKRNTAPQMARALLVLIKRFFGWCVDQEIYGLSTSPCEGLSGKKLIGELQSRDRRLSNDEIFAFWTPGAWATRLVRSIACCCSPA